MLFLFLVLAIFGNGSANADYIPGRVRAHVMADMKVEVARGVFLGMRLLKISLNYEDGRPQPVSFSVTAKADASPVTLKINEVRKSSNSFSFFISELSIIKFSCFFFHTFHSDKLLS